MKIKTFLHSWFLVAFLISIGFLAGFSIWARIANIDMTETRLLVTYWKEYLFFVVSTLLLGIGYKITEK